MCKTTPVILQRLFSASKCPPTHLSMEKGLMACLAFDKKFILDDFLQEATNTDILQIQIHIQIQIHWLLIKVLSWKIFCRKPQTGSFYHNLGRRLSASGDFQDTIISTHFTNIIRANYCGFMSSSSYETLFSSYGMFINRTNSNIYIAL